MGERGMQVKSDCLQRSWENSEFPMLCETCFGDNPYVRMQIDRYGAACKMCDRPFTVFKWRPGRGEGYKKTEVCQSCARTKNLCQCCILDMQLGLPSQLRDAVLHHIDDQMAEPLSSVNKEYVVQQQLVALENTSSISQGGIANQKLIQLARSANQNRDQPRVNIIRPTKDTSTKGTAEEASIKRKISEIESEMKAPALPPGITSMEQIASSVDISRLPAAMQNFINKQFNKPASDDKKQEPSSTEDSKKLKKQKFAPKPPSGPPPDVALVK